MDPSGAAGAAIGTDWAPRRRGVVDDGPTCGPGVRLGTAAETVPPDAQSPPVMRQRAWPVLDATLPPTPEVTRVPVTVATSAIIAIWDNAPSPLSPGRRDEFMIVFLEGRRMRETVWIRTQWGGGSEGP